MSQVIGTIALLGFGYACYSVLSLKVTSDTNLAKPVFGYYSDDKRALWNPVRGQEYSVTHVANGVDNIYMNNAIFQDNTKNLKELSNKGL